MNWDDYVQQNLFPENNDLLAFSYSKEGKEDNSPLPFYIKCIVNLSDFIALYGSNRQIIRYPADEYFPLSFAVYKTVRDVVIGNAKSKYDVKTFKKGQKLLLFGSVVQFDHVGFDPSVPDEEGKPTECIYYQLKKKNNSEELVTREWTIDKSPVFRTAIDSAKISCASAYEKTKTINAQYDQSRFSGRLKMLWTMQQEAYILVCPIRQTTALCQSFFLDQSPLLDSLAIAKADFDGNLTPIAGPAEKPQIILVSDLGAVPNVIRNANSFSVHNVIIQSETIAQFDSYVDEFEVLKQLDITCRFLVPENSDLNLKFLSDEEGFKEIDFTRNLISTNAIMGQNNGWASRMLENCKHRALTDVECKSQDIIDTFEILKKYEDSNKEMPGLAQDCFQDFETVFFSELWRCLPLSVVEENVLKAFNHSLFECQEHRNLIPDRDFVEDMTKCGECFKRLYDRKVCHKESLLEDFIKQHLGQYLLLVLPHAYDPIMVKGYYTTWMARNGITDVTLDTCTDRDFSNHHGRYDEIILAGWLGRWAMIQVLLSNKAPHFTVLVHQCELSWTVNVINQLNLSKEISLHSLDQEIDSQPNDLPTISFVPTQSLSDKKNEKDFGGLYHDFQEGHYRRYAGSSDPKAKLVDATPVKFNDDTFGFFTDKFTFTRLNKLLDSNGQPESVGVEELKVGDILAVSSSSSDIIKDFADQILKASNLPNARKIATSWKDSLILHQELTDQELYQKLKDAGLTKGFITVKTWLHKPSFICPMDENDLRVISQAFNDNVLLETYHSIFTAAKQVKSAHIVAGKRLVLGLMKDPAVGETISQLGTSLTTAAKDFVVEGFGTVTILSVTEIGVTAKYVYENTNKMRKDYN
jgi:hypothetical protein